MELRDWVIKIANPDRERLIELRDLPGAKIAVDTDTWLRGSFIGPDEAVSKTMDRLRSILGAERYHLETDGRLTPFGRRVPIGRLPELAWQPLSGSIDVEPPIAGLAGRPESRTMLSLARGGTEFLYADCEPTLLLCGLEDWSQFVNSASLARLSKLEFAVNDQRQVLVLGVPIPPVQGQLFLLVEEIAIPLGYHWQPSVSPNTVRQVFDPAADSIVVWFPDGKWNQVALSHFQPATRFGVHDTVRSFEK